MNKRVILITVTTVALAGMAIVTAWFLYQQSTKPVAPTAPASKPKAQSNEQTVELQAIEFQLAQGGDGGTAPTGSLTPMPTSTVTPTPTKAPTGTTTPTPTLTPTPTSSGGGGGGGSTATATPTKTSSSSSSSSSSGSSSTSGSGTTTLPAASFSWPTIVAAGTGILIFIVGLVLVL